MKLLLEQWRRYLKETLDHSNSGMIALLVPGEVVSKLEQLGIVFQDIGDKPHVTLLYLGKNLGAETKEKTFQILTNICKNQQPLEAQIGGFAKFVKGENGTPVVGLIDCPGLNQLQAKMESEVGKVLEPQSEHGFTAHMTLKYEKDGKEAELPQLAEPVKWTVGEVYLVVGEDWQSFKFGE